MASQDEAKRRFIEFCKEFNTRSKEIDSITPWSESEPQWWLDMMEIRRRTQRAVDAATPPSAEPLSGSDIVPAVEPDTQPRH